MPSLFSSPDFTRRCWRLLPALLALCWLTACQQSHSPEPPATAGAKPAPPAAAPAPTPPPPPAPAAIEAPQPTTAPQPAPLPAPPAEAPPQASVEPPRDRYLKEYQQKREQSRDQEQQARIEAPPRSLPPIVTGRIRSANGGGGGYGAAQPRLEARLPPAIPLPTPAPTTATAATAPIAQFDWPPPKASAQEAIPDKWLRTGQTPTLASVADKFEKAMKLAGYMQRSYYSVPRGFALAAQFEHIRADGTPLPGDDRWRVGTPRIGNLSLLAFIQALAHAPPGIYRAIVFVVTDAPWAQSTTAPSEAQIMAWAGAGAASLPPAIGDLPYGPNYRAHALIYEFRKGNSGPAETVQPSAVSGETHLDRGGLWDPLSIL